MTLCAHGQQEVGRVGSELSGRFDFEHPQIAVFEPRCGRHNDALHDNAVPRSVAQNRLLVQGEVQVAAVHNDVCQPRAVDRNNAGEFGKDGIRMYRHAKSPEANRYCDTRLSQLHRGCNGNRGKPDCEIYLKNKLAAGVAAWRAAHQSIEAAE